MAATQGKTARRPAARAQRRGSAGGTLLGIFIGLVMGLALAAGVAFYLGGGRSVYQAQVQAQKDTREPARDAAKAASADKAGNGAAAADKPRFDFYKILPGGEEPKIAASGKPEPPKPDRAVADKARAADKGTDKAAEKAADKATAGLAPNERAVDVAKLSDKGLARNAATAPAEPRSPSGKDRYWLQAGSFTDQADAENLKARLALAGWEAAVQQGVLADKSVRYRVRLGPYDNGEELARMKNQLAQRGYESAAIRY